MKKTSVTLALLALAFVISAALSSCSIIGYTIGSDLDHGAAHDTVSIFSDIDDYKGQTACIRYNDTSIRYAAFDGYSEEPSASYSRRYAAFEKAHPISEAPLSLGDSVVLIGKHSDLTGNFGGFLPNGILIDGQTKHIRSYYDNEGTDYLWLLLPPFAVPFMIARVARNHAGEIDSMWAPHLSKSFSKVKLQLFLEANAVPIRATLDFSSGKEHFRYTNDDFKNVAIMPHHASGRWIGLAIGAAIDITVIVAAVIIGRGLRDW